MSELGSVVSRPMTRGSVAAAALAQSVPESSANAFVDLMNSPQDVLADQLKAGEYKDIQELCKFIGVSAKGARAELAARVLEFKSKLASGDACMPAIVGTRGGVSVELLSTPENRPGRFREPHLGGPVLSWPGSDQVPALPGSINPSSNAAAADEPMDESDPLQKSDPWKHFALSTPQTRRSNNAHSGITPALSEKFQRMEEFLNTPGSLEPSAPITTSDDNPVLAAILAGVQSLQRNSVTREQMKQLVELQREEFHTYVRAETEPLHNAVTELHCGVVKLSHDTHQASERITKLEGRVTQFQSSGAFEQVRDANDPAYKQIAFLNFPAESSVYQRLKAMHDFMSTHFPKVTPVGTNLFSDNNGDPSIHGFVQVVDSKCAKRIVEECAAQKWKVDGFPNVRVKRAKAAVDLNRDWALHRAEELVKQHPAAAGKAVALERGSSTRERGIYIDGVRVFEQVGIFSKDGVFLHAFASLCLR